MSDMEEFGLTEITSQLPDYFDEYEPHPFAELFPRMDGAELVALRESLLMQGMLHPIIIYQGKILSGVTRHTAWKSDPEQIHPIVREFKGDPLDALNIAVNTNMKQRNYPLGARAIAAVKKVDLERELPKTNKKRLTQENAAEQFRVSTGYIEYASKIMKAGNQDLIDAVVEDRIPINIAAKLTEVNREIQDQAILDPKQAKILLANVSRRQREHKLATDTVAASRQLDAMKEQNTVYGVLYIDPPWKFEVYDEATGLEKSPDQHYPTMTLEEIRALHIPAHTDCAMFLWSTVPHLANAIEVMEGWGFTYKTCFVWHKLNHKGTGYWSRSTAEILLLGTKGSVPAPMPDQMMDQVQGYAVGKHSEKPEGFASAITRMFPTTPKLEMFARKNSQRDNTWHYWGNEITETEFAMTDQEEQSLAPKKEAAKPKRNRNAKRNSKTNGGSEAHATKSEGGDIQPNS